VNNLPSQDYPHLTVLRPGVRNVSVGPKLPSPWRLFCTWRNLLLFMGWYLLFMIFTVGSILVAGHFVHGAK
jgi:hypothetical protein